MRLPATYFTKGNFVKRKRTSKGPFVAVPKRITGAPAWRAMSPEGRLLWIDLRGWLRNDGLNNGKVHRSCRDAAEALGLHKDTIARRFVENEHYGFLRKTAEGFLGSDGRGIAAKYRFTDLAHGTHPATRDYEKWDGSIFENPPRKSGWKKQNPVLPRRTPCPTASDIRTAPGEGSVCPTASDIGSASKCPTASDISRLPLPAAGEGGIQGSSTARAPVQAGGAGSSPAPVTRLPDLTEHVLRIVNEQLDELDARRGPKPLLPWSTPALVEVTDPAEKAALRGIAEQPPVTASSVPATERAGLRSSPLDIPEVRKLIEWHEDEKDR